VILVDTREKLGEYMKSEFDSIGVKSEVCTLPHSSGADFYISNTYGSCAIQRKRSMEEICGTPVSDRFASAMEELRLDILPHLITYTTNPILLVEESHRIGECGSLFRKEGSMFKETGTTAASYYGFLESVRKMGVDVVTLKAEADLMPTIWYLASMDGYLSREHYPRHLKSYNTKQQSIGMLCCIPGIGAKRAAKALETNSIKDIATKSKIEGLTIKQHQKIKRVLEWK
jgi:ERCC4-type nuclease